MSRILYFIQVPWDWIKQRPHFLAEGLSSSGHDVTVVHNKPYTRFNLVGNERPAGLRFLEPYLLPCAYLSRANSFLATVQLRELLTGSDIVWLTHPFQYAQIGKAISPRHRVVYDCMDDNLAFDFVKNNKKLSDRLFTVEQQLLHRSDLVIASSRYLKDELVRRYGLPGEMHVVNNGICMDDGHAPEAAAQGTGAITAEKCKTVSYIGTIAEWFDFDLVLKSLSRNENIRYDLYGPARVPIPHHERLRYHGQIDHGRVFEVMKQADALIMPFVLNELVLSINPVKLYEYTYSHKPAIAVNYGETAKFGEFVHLYDSADEYCHLLDQLVENRLTPKKSEKECIGFAQANTWDKRVERIGTLLAGITKI